MEQNRVFRARWTEITIGVIGLVCVLVNAPGLMEYPWFLTVFLCALATMLEALPIPVGTAVTSLLVALPLGVVAVYGTAEAVTLLFVGEFVVCMTVSHRQFSTAFFNAGQYAICGVVLSAVYHWFQPGLPNVTSWHTVLGVLAGSLCFLICNHLFIHLISMVFGSLEWGQVHRAFYADAINMLACMPFAALTIIIGVSHPYIAPVVILPIVLLGQFLRVYTKMKYMQQVHSATIRLTSEFDIERICEEAARVTRKLTYADAVAIFTMDEEKRALITTTVYPVEQATELDLWELPQDEGGVIWQVINQNGWEYVPDTLKDPRVNWDGTGEPWHSMAIFPMQSRGTVQGAIVCYAHRPYAFGDLTDYIVTLSSQVAVLLDNARLYQKMQEQSVRDGATGLYNYRFFYRALAKQFEGARVSGTPLSVAIVDVDYFKKFNDTYGHLAGDAVLRSIGRLMTETVGSQATVARYGGEEFGIILPFGPEETFGIMEQLRLAAFHHVVDYDGYQLQGITVSIGIASYPEDSDNDRDLLLKADSAMYWGAKQQGRNRTALYSPSIDAQLFVDNVTGLYTHHFLSLRLREELAKGITRWGMICIDVQHMHQINQTFGFDMGNQVLKEIGMILKECVRQTELVSRFAGDEFLVLLQNVGVEEVEHIALRIRKTVAARKFVLRENVIVPVRVSALGHSIPSLEDPADLFDTAARYFTSMQQAEGESLA